MTKPHPTRAAGNIVEDAGFLCSSLGPEDTGVDGATIWCFAGEFTHHEVQLGPRVQVSLGGKLTVDALADSVPVTLTSPPEVLGSVPPKVETQALAFVIKNRDVLLKHWDGAIDTAEVIERLQRG